MPKNDKDEKIANFFMMGVFGGLLLGTVVGLVVIDNLALGIGVGMALGSSVGAVAIAVTDRNSKK